MGGSIDSSVHLFRYHTMIDLLLCSAFIHGGRMEAGRNYGWMV
jgi:hypothetical protein